MQLVKPDLFKARIVLSLSMGDFSLSNRRWTSRKSTTVVTRSLEGAFPCSSIKAWQTCREAPVGGRASLVSSFRIPWITRISPGSLEGIGCELYATRVHTGNRQPHTPASMHEAQVVIALWVDLVGALNKLTTSTFAIHEKIKKDQAYP